MKVRIVHIDGSLPNLALMRLSHYHKRRGDTVHFTSAVERELYESDEYDRCYASSIFTKSQHRVDRVLDNFPDAIIGGTGTGDNKTLEQLCPGIGNGMDYSCYPSFQHSIGFLMRGCRLKCGFCVVPKKEGKPVHNMNVDHLWRGYPHPKHLLLLDNDFFGVHNWRRHVDDIVSGQFKVCFSQGINVRMIGEEEADALSHMNYRDNKFKEPRLYTAWDNMGQEKVFFRGVDMLEAAGVPATHLMAYMLIGWAKGETISDIEYRFMRMVDRGIKPYPMVYGNNPTLKHFQRWAIRRYYKIFPFSEYKRKGN